MTIRMASPLYIVRQDCEKDLFAVLRRLAEAGFDGIEFLGFFGHGAKEVRQKLDELGLAALGNHVPYKDLAADPKTLLDFHQEVGCEYLTVADLPLADFAKVAESLDRIADLARARGMRLLFHNHDGELIDRVEGKAALQYILDNTRPETLALEPDLGWMEVGGGDCAWYLATYRDRCPVIHLKDYYSSDNSKLGRVRDFVPARGGADRGRFEFRPTGYGVLNLPKLMPLCLSCEPAWLIQVRSPNS